MCCCCCRVCAVNATNCVWHVCVGVTHRLGMSSVHYGSSSAVTVQKDSSVLMQFEESCLCHGRSCLWLHYAKCQMKLLHKAQQQPKFPIWAFDLCAALWAIGALLAWAGGVHQCICASVCLLLCVCRNILNSIACISSPSSLHTTIWR